MIAVLVSGLILVTLPDDGGQPQFTATAAEPEARLTLHLVDPATGKAGSAMFAKVHREGSSLTLTPRFPLSHGQTYRAILTSPDGSTIAEDYQAPDQEVTQPQLTRVLPTAELLPANLLKFYLHFSEPMREGVAIFDQIHLEDSQGERVYDPWRRQELWNEDRTRLTLWIHPGRVKKGVNLRETLGPVLRPNECYALIIDGTLRSAKGAELGKTQRHAFATGPEDYSRPLPESWNLSVPQAGTREALRIKSPKPLDHALVKRHVIVSLDGTRIPCEVEVAPGDREWTMIPAEPWQAREYALKVSEYLEDLAGNTPDRVFDTDLEAPEAAPAVRKLRFQPTT